MQKKACENKKNRKVGDFFILGGGGKMKDFWEEVVEKGILLGRDGNRRFLERDLGCFVGIVSNFGGYFGDGDLFGEFWDLGKHLGMKTFCGWGIGDFFCSENVGCFKVNVENFGVLWIFLAIGE